MRWQDETPVHELVAEGARMEGTYLTIARVGKDRKEAQISSRPVETVASARGWLDHTVAGVVNDGGDAKLRIRLWRADRSPVRGVTTRVWADDGGAAAERETALVLHGGEITGDQAVEGTAADSPLALMSGSPRQASLDRRPQPVATRMPSATRRPVRFQAQAAPAPVYAAPCPTCAAATTTTALLQSRIAELSAMLGTASNTVRDARRDATEAEKLATSRGQRAKEAEAEVARVRAENAELLGANRSLRREVKDLNEGAAKLLAALKALDE